MTRPALRHLADLFETKQFVLILSFTSQPPQSGEQ